MQSSISRSIADAHKNTTDPTPHRQRHLAALEATNRRCRPQRRQMSGNKARNSTVDDTWRWNRVTCVFLVHSAATRWQTLGGPVDLIDNSLFQGKEMDNELNPFPLAGHQRERNQDKSVVFHFGLPLCFSLVPCACVWRCVVPLFWLDTMSRSSGTAQYRCLAPPKKESCNDCFIISPESFRCTNDDDRESCFQLYFLYK